MKSILLVSFLIWIPSAGESQIRFSSNSLDFGSQPIGTTLTKKFQVFNDNSKGEICVTIKGLVKSTYAFTFNLVTRRIKATSFVEIVAEFNPREAKYFVDELIIEYEIGCGDGPKRSIALPVSGLGICSGAAWKYDCDPIGPLCSIENYEYRGIAEIPMNYWTDQVLPSMDIIYSYQHPSPYDYEVPLDFLLKMGALDVLTNIPAVSCEEEVQFKKANLEYKSAIKWVGKSGPISLTPKVHPSGVQLTIGIPQTFTGFSNIGSGYAEFVFDNTTMPTFQLVAPGGLTQSSKVQCISVRTDNIYILLDNGGTQQNPHFNLTKP